MVFASILAISQLAPNSGHSSQEPEKRAIFRIPFCLMCLMQICVMRNRRPLWAMVSFHNTFCSKPAVFAGLFRHYRIHYLCLLSKIGFLRLWMDGHHNPPKNAYFVFAGRKCYHTGALNWQATDCLFTRSRKDYSFGCTKFVQMPHQIPPIGAKSIKILVLRSGGLGQPEHILGWLGGPKRKHFVG